MFGFEKLDVWTKALDGADHVYHITDQFPKEEMFGLKSQIRRSAASVSANVAEGSGLGSARDFIQFLTIAYGSLVETISHLHLARRRSLLEHHEFNAVYSEAEELARMLSGLRKSLETRERT